MSDLPSYESDKKEKKENKDEIKLNPENAQNIMSFINKMG